MNSEHAAALHIKYYWETDTISPHDTTSGKGHHCRHCRGSSTPRPQSARLLWKWENTLGNTPQYHPTTLSSGHSVQNIHVTRQSSGSTDSGLSVALLPTQRLDCSTIKFPLFFFSKYASETSTLTHLTSPDENRPTPAAQVGQKKRGSLSTFIPHCGWIASADAHRPQ